MLQLACCLLPAGYHAALAGSAALAWQPGCASCL